MIHIIRNLITAQPMYDLYIFYTQDHKYIETLMAHIYQSE